MVQALWVSDTALCGDSVNNKDKSGKITKWATPLVGQRSKSRRYEPILKCRGDFRIGRGFFFSSPAYPPRVEERLSESRALWGITGAAGCYSVAMRVSERA